MKTIFSIQFPPAKGDNEKPEFKKVSFWYSIFHIKTFGIQSFQPLDFRMNRKYKIYLFGYRILTIERNEYEPLK